MDALPQAGSTASISLMVDILKVRREKFSNEIKSDVEFFSQQENKLSSRQTLSWYLSLPLAKFADLDAIKAVLVSSLKSASKRVA